MYTILINSDNTLTQSTPEKIMHRESNVHTFRFLVDPIWVDKGVETPMQNYTCVLEYRTPISEKYTPVILTPSEELYKGKLEYTLPIDLKLTSEIGNLELKFIFTWLEMNPNGTFTEHSRKTLTTTVYIIPVSQWSDYVASSDLDSIVQMMLTIQAQNEQMKDYTESFIATKADGIAKDSDTNEIYLTSNGVKLGKGVIDSESSVDEEGIPVVDFTVVEPEDTVPELNNIIEF